MSQIQKLDDVHYRMRAIPMIAGVIHKNEANEVTVTMFPARKRESAMNCFSSDAEDLYKLLDDCGHINIHVCTALETKEEIVEEEAAKKNRALQLLHRYLAGFAIRQAGVSGVAERVVEELCEDAHVCPSDEQMERMKVIVSEGILDAIDML